MSGYDIKRSFNLNSEASPTIWSGYADSSLFINRENNQVLKK